MSRRGSAPRRRRRGPGVALLTGVLVGLGGLDLVAAFWTAGSTAPGFGAVGLISVNRANTPAVSVTGRDIVVDWDPSTMGNGMAVTGYTVQRYSTAEVLQTTLAGCSGTVTTTVCTEADVPNGLWTYAITPRFASNWAGPQSARSAQVRSDGTAPSNTIARNVVSGASSKTGNVVYYRGAAAGSFTLSSAVTDAQSGPASASTATPGGTTSGWTHMPSTVSTPSGGPYVSNPFSWTAGTTSEPTVAVTARDVNGNEQVTTLTLTDDSTAPTAGPLSHVTGAQTITTLPITLPTVTESQSGVASHSLQQRTATLTGNSCGTFGAYSTVSTAATSPINRGVSYGNCYEYQWILTDAVGNAASVAGSGVLRNRNYGSVVNNTTGRLSHWRLNGAATSAATVATGGSSNTVTWAGGPTFQAAGAISADSDTAVSFDGVDDAGTVNRGLTGGDLSVEFWFKSTQGLGNGTNWYGGAGLVDGDVAGNQNDFGVALSADGRVLAGTGNTLLGLSDTTIRSGTGFNDGAWHHVVFTRSNAGFLALYVDGTERASGVGRIGTQAASAQLAFGRILSGGNFYAGALDEVATYDAVLPAATVLNHHQTGLP